jgi:hypothetical protein
MMNISNPLCYEFENLMTPEELEEMNFSYDDIDMESTPTWLPDASDEDKAKFLRRKPALGLTKKELQDLKEHVRASGVLSPIPDWYVFSPVSHGPRKVDSFKCENRECFVTEDVSRRLFRCAACKMPLYCSKECQKADWVARHKTICKKFKEQREQTAQAGDFISMLDNMGK